MANWVKGKLKIRGKPEDIKRWVEECLHCYFTKWFRDGSYEDELVDDAVVFEHDPKAREMRLDTIEDAYIEGTKRNFVEKGVYGDSYREDEKPILVVSMKAVWNVDETPYIEMSKMYNVDQKCFLYYNIPVYVGFLDDFHKLFRVDQCSIHEPARLWDARCKSLYRAITKYIK